MTVSREDWHESTDAQATRESRSEAPEDRERRVARKRGQRREPRAERLDRGRASAAVAERAFTALADAVRDHSIFLLDATGIITFWGVGAERLAGWSADEAEGAHLRLIYPAGGSRSGTADSHLRQAAEQGEHSTEGERERRDGTAFWARCTLVALRNERGDLLGFAGLSRDLTASRQADALLTTAAAASEAARATAVANASARMEFLATVSHEIRTPVNAILGYHELLGMGLGGPLTAPQIDYLDRASASGRHLLSIIDDVLDFARVDAERVQVTRRAFRLSDVISDALSTVAPQARQRGITLTDASGGAARSVAAWGDAARVRQVLVNLLSNAVKFTQPDRETDGRVTVSAGIADRPSPDAVVAEEGPWAFVRVEDTGSGVPSDRLEAIFEPFVQADMTLTRRHGGTGLGLAISRRLARLMGGDLTARSEPGLGSTFLLWLPLASREETAADSEVVPADPLRADAPPPPPLAGLSPARIGALGEIAHAILDELESILQRYIDRLRTDERTPSAHGADPSRIEDHLATYLADLAATLSNVDVPDREAIDTLRDSSAIQRTIARRHGAQRARLGWRPEEVGREFEIMEEEILAAIERAGPAHLRSATEAQRLEELERVVSLLRRFLAAARRLSVESHALAMEAARAHA
ncbi:MAG TPA: ATP-binding protein [Gemmatimonadaceae bacterium]|nr:ATP-binding protein [Gemmatimonadaceae bacterium]